MATIGIIGGSGLASGLEAVLSNPTTTGDLINDWGTVSKHTIGLFNDLRVVVMARHNDEVVEHGVYKPGRSPAVLTQQRAWEANIWKMHEENVEAIYAISAVGGLDPTARVGTIVVPHDYLRGFATTQHSYGTSAQNVHTNMNEPFDPSLRKNLIAALQHSGASFIHKGVYIWNGGDPFETNTEISVLDRMTQGIPHRIVGMTVIPEAILAAQMAIPYAALCVIVNPAQGVSSDITPTHDQTKAAMHQADAYIKSTVKNLLSYHQGL